MTNPHSLILKYWENVEARGEKPLPVYTVISTGGEQPVGYCLGWSVSKKAAEQRAEAYSGTSKIERLDRE